MILVIVGLYRRDPAAQRRWAAVRGRVLASWRRLRRRPGRTVYVKAASEASVSAQVRGSVRPGQRDPDAYVEQRLGWLEHAVDIAFRELTAERLYRTDDVQNLREKAASLRSDYNAEVSGLRRRLDEVGIPERLEWWGAGLVFASLGFGVLDTVVAGG